MEYTEKEKAIMKLAKETYLQGYEAGYLDAVKVFKELGHKLEAESMRLTVDEAVRMHWEWMKKE